MTVSYDIYTLLKEIFFTLDDGDKNFFKQFDLSTPRFYALLHLTENPGISSRRLSELMLCDKSNVTRIIKGLEDEGLVLRKEHETDRRASRLYVTDDGRVLSERVSSAHRQFNQSRFADVDLSDESILADVLLTLRKDLQSHLDYAKENESVFTGSVPADAEF